MTRHAHIDIAKGLGIIMVVTAHAGLPFLGQLFYCFHMPLFIVISGMLFKPAPPAAYALKKAVHLLLPYAVFLFFFVWQAPRPHFETILDRPDYPHPYRIILFGGQHLVSYAMVFWFATCLFLTQQIFNGLVRWAKPRHVQWIAIACYAVSLLDAAYIHQPWPWGLNVCLGAIPFFAIGYYARPWFVNGRGTLPALLAFLPCIWTVYQYGDRFAYNMKYAQYGVPVVSLIFALAATKLVMEFSVYLEKYPRVAAPVIWCGAASLVIMFLGQRMIYLVGDTRFYESYWLKSLVGIGMPLGVYWIARQVGVLRLLLLGDYAEFQALRRRLAGSA